MDPNLSRAFSLIAQLQGFVKALQGQLGGEAVRINTDTLTWPGSSNYSATKTITHGLGFTPVAVIVLATGDPGASNEIRAHSHSLGASTFKAFAKYDPTTPVAAHTESIVWVAFGVPS